MALDETKFGAFHLEKEPAVFRKSWFLNAGSLYTLTPYPNGISLSEHDPPQDTGELAQTQLSRFDLRLSDTKHSALPKGTYFFYRENFKQVLRHRLVELHKQDALSQSAWILGLTADPFLNADRTGSVVTACLQQFGSYQPGLLYIQTRSSKILSSQDFLALPRDRVVVSVPIESCNEAAIARYTTGQPTIKERIALLSRLRAEGFTVHAKVSPALPYGDFYRDAWKFAELLVTYADYISFADLESFIGTSRANSALRQRLQIDRQLKFLEPFSYRCIYYAVQSLAVHKLQVPSPFVAQAEQMILFPAQGN